MGQLVIQTNKAKTNPIPSKVKNERFCVDREPYNDINNATRGILTVVRQVYHP